MCGLREEEYEMYGRYKAKVSEKLSTHWGREGGGRTGRREGVDVERGYYVVTAGIHADAVG